MQIMTNSLKKIQPHFALGLERELSFWQALYTCCSLKPCGELVKLHLPLQCDLELRTVGHQRGGSLIVCAPHYTMMSSPGGLICLFNEFQGLTFNEQLFPWAPSNSYPLVSLLETTRPYSAIIDHGGVEKDVGGSLETVPYPGKGAKCGWL